MIALLLVLAVAPAVPCPGIVLHHGRTARCTPQPPLVDGCTAVRACRGTAVCAITVTGKLTVHAYRADEAWGDWLARLSDAPPEWRLKVAAIERLPGRPVARPPYTIFLAAGRSPVLADMLFVDDLGWLRDYAGTGAMPAGLRRAPADMARRICSTR